MVGWGYNIYRFVFLMDPVIRGTKLKHCKETCHNIPFGLLNTHHPPPLKALFGLKPFVALARRNLSLHCVFSTVFDHSSLDRILCWDISAVYFIFCSEFPAEAFVSGASIRGQILCQIIFHPTHTPLVTIVMVNIVDPKQFGGKNWDKLEIRMRLKLS